jgi:hypothetical protein
MIFLATRAHPVLLWPLDNSTSVASDGRAAKTRYCLFQLSKVILCRRRVYLCQTPNVFMHRPLKAAFIYVLLSCLSVCMSHLVLLRPLSKWALRPRPRRRRRRWASGWWSGQSRSRGGGRNCHRRKMTRCWRKQRQQRQRKRRYLQEVERCYWKKKEYKG